MPTFSGASPQAVTPDPNSANPKGEGLYTMQSPDGRSVQIPYSKIQTVSPQGYRFANHGELARYARDHQADPVDENRVNQFIDKLPPWDPTKILMGLGTGVAKAAAGADRIARGNGALTRPEEMLQEAAATPTKGAGEALGEGVENAGEFFTGEELLGLASKALPFAERLKQATGLAQTLSKSPTLAKIARIGLSAIKQGTIAGGQTYVKTGGDAGAAGATAGLGAGGAVAADLVGATGSAISGMRKGAAAEAAPMVEREVGGVKIPVAEEAANAVATPTAAKSAEAYAALSKGILRDSLEKLETSPQQTENALNTTHDLTGTVRRQQEVLKPIYDNLNEATDGKFRELNSQVQSAKSLARAGDPEAVAAYKNKLAEMDDLLDKVPSIAGRKDLLQRVKDVWYQNNIIDDFAGKWDKNMNGAPGASKVANEQRGMNGNGLMADIQSTIKTYGRDRVEKGLGADRLAEWENIARWNQTNAKRKAFNMGVQEIASNLPKQSGITPFGKRATAMVAGGIVGHLAGASPYMGALGGEATYEATHAVLNAIKANPKIAQNFMFALESGASSAKYGPFIATMIQQYETEASRQRQADEQLQTQ